MPSTSLSVLGTNGTAFFALFLGDSYSIGSPSDGTVKPSSIASSGDFVFPADIRLKDADGSHYVGFRAPSTVSSNVIWTLPAADGSSNQYLKTDGSGALGWASDAGTDATNYFEPNSATFPSNTTKENRLTLF